MRLGLYGYGKMGRVIEGHALQRGHLLNQRVGSNNAGEQPADIEVAIEFSRPECAFNNIELLLKSGIPVVVGTTGWYDRLNEVKDLIKEYEGALLYASNFSIGVNLFFRLNRFLSGLMNGHEQYNASMVEEHHVHKLDAPSGTALTLARDLILQHKDYESLTLQEPQEKELPIESVREGEIPGTHRLVWTSNEDELSIEHKAFGRDGFALGAVHAAEWLIAPQSNGERRKGLFTFDDVLSNI